MNILLKNLPIGWPSLDYVHKDTKKKQKGKHGRSLKLQRAGDKNGNQPRRC